MLTWLEFIQPFLILQTLFFDLGYVCVHVRVFSCVPCVDGAREAMGNFEHPSDASHIGSFLG